MGEKVMGACCMYKCGLERGLGLGEGRIVGWGGEVGYVQVWTRTREYLTIGWMVVGSFAIMFEDDISGLIIP